MHKTSARRRRRGIICRRTLVRNGHEANNTIRSIERHVDKAVGTGGDVAAAAEVLEQNLLLDDLSVLNHNAAHVLLRERADDFDPETRDRFLAGAMLPPPSRAT